MLENIEAVKKKHFGAVAQSVLEFETDLKQA
jgi:hypothetical protein